MQELLKFLKELSRPYYNKQIEVNKFVLVLFTSKVIFKFGSENCQPIYLLSLGITQKVKVEFITIVLSFLKRERFPLFVPKRNCIPDRTFLGVQCCCPFACTVLTVSDRLQIKTVLKRSETFV